MSRLPSRAEELPVQRSVGRFVITRRLGAGAMGTVYEAHDPDLNRRVALKIVGQPGQTDSLRLLREAQALAQLQHPSVVVIHDVGAMQEGVFIAMELVDGENLRDHFADSSQPWKRALALYLQAGRGLAAANEKSIVHRDFKPANVLVDRQGRVRVTDFGLARLARNNAIGRASATITSPPHAVTDTVTEDVTRDQPPAAQADTALLASPLTHEGALLGTPRYMAPEQRARRPATARSDQYSFCVCVWEAVFGVHPFPDGQDAFTVPRRSGRKAPRWLVRALERGLSFDPAHRHPSMTALLDDLERAPRIRRRGWMAVAAVTILGVGTVMSLQARSASDPCRSVEPLQAWTPEARIATRAAFLASGLPYATRVHDTVSQRLDDYAARWRAMNVETCRARVAGTQSAEMLERRHLCLDRRQDEVGALVAAMRVIPRDRVEKAIEALGNLGDLHACEDADALSRGAALPQDAARADQVRALEREIATVEAQQSIGRPDDRSASVEELLAMARALEYSPVLLRALDLKVDLAWDSDRWQELVDLSQQQLVVAEAAGDDRARFLIYTMLVQGNSRIRRHDEAAHVGRLADALLQRFGDDPELAAKLHCAQSNAEWQAGNFQESLRLAKMCVAERERVSPRDGRLLGNSLQHQAIAEMELKRYDEALATLTRSIEHKKSAVGERHPEVASALNVMGYVQHSLGRVDLAEPLYRRAVSILEESRGDSSELAAPLQNLANLHLSQEKYGDAIASYRRILSVFERKLPLGDNRISNTLDMLGKALARSGKFEEGEATLLRSIALREANGNGNHPAQATAWRILGGQYRLANRHDKARDAFAQSLRILETKYGTKHPLLVTSLIGVAEAELDRGHPHAARPLLERALPHLDAEPVRPDRAILQFLLARALWATPGERTRARKLADAALEQARADGDTEDLPMIEAWLETHVAP
jgi:eukaryotic-like serine/threonine-protein kinase